MNMNSPSNSFTQGIDNTVEANKFNPQGLQQEVAQNSRKPLFEQDFIKLISAEILSKEMADKQNAVKLALNPESSTIADQTFQKLNSGMEADVAQRVAGVNAVKAADKNKRMQQFMGQQGARTQPLPTNQQGAGIQSLPTNLSMDRNNAASMSGIVGAAMGGRIRGYDQGGVVSFDGTTDGSLVDGDAAAVAEPYTVGTAVEKGTDYVVELAADNILATIALGIATSRVQKVRRGGETIVRMSKSVYDDALAVFNKTSGPRRNQRLRNRAGNTVYAGAGAATISDVLDIPLDDGTSTKPVTKDSAAGTGLDTGTGITETDEERMQRLLAEEMKESRLTDEANAAPDAIDASTVRQQAALRESSDATDTGILATRTLGEKQADSRETYEDNLRGSVKRGESELNAGIMRRQNLATNTEDDLEKGQGDYITDLENLASEARGGRREALRDLLYGLSQVSRGSNLGDGLGISARTMMNREQGREDKAFGIDQKIADTKRGDVTELNALRLSNNAGVQDLRTSLANMRTDNQRMMASANADTARLAQTNLQTINNLTQIAADVGLKSSTIEFKGVVAKLEAASRAATLAVQARANEIQAEGQTSKNLIGIIEGLSDMTDSLILLDNKSPKLPGLIERSEKFLGQLETILVEETAEPEPPT